MKAHFTHLNNPFSNTGFLTPFKLAYNTNHIQEGAAIWVLPFFVEKALATMLNSILFTATHIAPSVSQLGQILGQAPTNRRDRYPLQDAAAASNSKWLRRSSIVWQSRRLVKTLCNTQLHWFGRFSEPESSASPMRNTRCKKFHRQSKSSSAMAVSTTSSTFIKTSRTFTSLTLLLLLSHAYKIYLDQAHQTLAFSYSLPEGPTHLAAIRADGFNNSGHHLQRPPRLSQLPDKNSNRHFDIHRHPSSSSGQTPKFHSPPLAPRLQRKK